MSWKPLKINVPIRQTRSLSPKKPTLMEPLRTSHQVRAAYLRRADTVATPTGVFAIQRGRASQTATTSSPLQHGTRSHHVSRSSSTVQPSSPLPELSIVEPGWSSSFSDPHEVPSSSTVLKTSKAKKQWLKWTLNIIPSLLQPYLSLLRTTDSLRNLHHDTEVVCTCGGLNIRRLTVTCLYFDCKLSYYLHIEPCIHILCCSVEGGNYCNMPMLNSTACSSCPWFFSLHTCCTQSRGGPQVARICTPAVPSPRS